MPKISFLKERPPIEVALEANLMDTLLSAGLPVASSCFGDGVCGKCRLEIISGAERLSPPNPAELLLRERYNLGPNIRIGCQTQVQGDVTVDASYW